MRWTAKLDYKNRLTLPREFVELGLLHDKVDIIVEGGEIRLEQHEEISVRWEIKNLNGLDLVEVVNAAGNHDVLIKKVKIEDDDTMTVTVVGQAARIGDMKHELEQD